MKKILIITTTVILLAISNVSAGTDGENSLSKKNSGQTKDCFEKVNRGIFAFIQTLDGAIFEPLAKGYRKLPMPIRRGTSNVLANLSSIFKSNAFSTTARNHNCFYNITIKIITRNRF